VVKRDCIREEEKIGSSLPGEGRIDEPDTLCGATRPHTPICDATSPPEKTIMKHLATGPTHENIHIFFMRTE
jgi:hypothetical protein